VTAEPTPGIRRAPGPGRGPNGVPAAIALTPILSARWRTRDLARIRAAAPGARLVTISTEGLADGPLDDVEVLLRGFLPAETFDRILARSPRLAWVHSASAGVERVLTPAGRERGLVITNARGVFSAPIAEYVLMMILAISRRLPQLLELQRERTWQPLEGTELRDVTVGIVGLGSIGSAVAELARGFGCRVVAIRRTAAPEDDGPVPDGTELIGGPERLAELLAESDFVVLALPLTPETEDLIDEAALAAMKPGAWLINIARGRLVDDHALARALREGPIGGAVLDAFREEPLPPTSPYYELPNVIVTPHTSWSSARVLDRSVELFCENIGRYARGEELLNVVDPAVGY
jgi:phosphoglycerate dehydrogenase-like enzyme